MELHDLNKHLFAAMLPETHGAKRKPGKTATPAPQYSAEQLATLAAASIDPATADSETVAAVLAAANLGGQ